jgi:hypothetical protein
MFAARVDRRRPKIEEGERRKEEREGMAVRAEGREEIGFARAVLRCD